MFYWRIRNSGRFAFIALILFGLGACNSKKPQVVFYPIDSLVSSQVIALSESNAILRKEAMLGSASDTAIATPDSLGWSEELNIFRQLDVINRPVNVGTYRITDEEVDPGSNLTIKEFVSTTDQPVRYLRIYYDRSIDRPRKIEALYREENALYRSTREMAMEFQQLDNTLVLTSYAILGSQKMVFEDSITFAVRGKVQFN